MFNWVLNAALFPVNNKERNILHEKLYGPFLWMGFNCLKATEPLRGVSFLFTTQSPAALQLGKKFDSKFLPSIFASSKAF